jgi:hypothetical protein
LIVAPKPPSGSASGSAWKRGIRRRKNCLVASIAYSCYGC